MRKSLTTIVATAAVAASIGFAGSGLVSAEAGAPAGVTKAQVKKIAKATATKQINALAPTLTVKSAKSADFATAAGTATTAQTAAAAAQVGGFNVTRFKGSVPNDAAAVSLGSLGGVTLNGTCPGGIPTVTATAAGGKLRFVSANGSNVVTTGGSNNVATASVSNLGAVDLGTTSFNYVSPAGSTVTGWLGLRNDTTTCEFFGSGLAG